MSSAKETSPREVVIIVASTTIVLSTLVFALRLYIRLKLNGPLGYDDAVCIVATVIGIAQSSVVLGAVHWGLGMHQKDLSIAGTNDVFLLIWVASILYILAICASKLSVSLLLTRMTRTKRRLYCSYAVKVSTLIWALTSVCLVAFQCNLLHPWDNSGNHSCLDLFAVWIGIEALSVALEMAILASAICVISGLDMAKTPKAICATAFSLRMLIIIPTIYRMDVLHSALTGPDITYRCVNAIVAQQIIMHMSIMAATFPCVERFPNVFHSGGLNTTANVPVTEFGAIRRSVPLQNYIRDGLQSNSANSGTRPTHPSRARVLRPEMMEMMTVIDGDATESEATNRAKSVQEEGSDLAINVTQKSQVVYGEDGRLTGGRFGYLSLIS